MTFLTLLMSLHVWAAPFPATSSSALISQEPGLFISPLGFSLKSNASDWKLVGPDKNSPLTIARFQPLKEKNAPATKPTAKEDVPTLSVRVDQVSENTSLDTYAKKWLREYPHYGFDILGSKMIQLEGNKALVVDLAHSKKERQLRQVVFQKDNRAVVLTCSDDKDSFAKSLSQCNQIIKSFHWTR
jgi:hypothetical protein